MKNIITLLILGLILIVSACTQKEKTCVITGKVINRPESTQLMLSKSFVDNRTQSTELIPIIDSMFRFEFNLKNVEAYDLVFEDEYSHGSWRPIIFFSTDGTINMELYPMNDYKKNIVSGGKENEEFLAFQKNKIEETEHATKALNDRLSALWDRDEYESEKMKVLVEKLHNTEKQEDKYKLYPQMEKLRESGEALSPAAKKLNAERDSIMKILQDKEIEYLSDHISIPSYYTLIEAILRTEDSPCIYDFDKLKSLQKKYAAKFQHHPYTQYSTEVLWRLANMKPGGDFYDFTLPDLEGKEHTLSDEIQGKYAYIDIWAPWCGPCIAKGRDMKPVFELYKDKGFTVVGVASKYQDLESVTNLLEKDQYPWMTLLDKPELDSRIVEHYGIEKAGGGCILVDNEGKVVKINPTADEVKAFLETNL